MSLVNMKSILEDAKNKGYAVGSFNMLSLETVRGAIKAAEEMNSPIILQLAEVHTPAAPIEYMAPIMLEAAKRAKVPVCVHFDHGTSVESVKKALEYGFTSVMFDGANNPFDENVKLTKQVVEFAHSKNATAEAELGQVGGAEDGSHQVEASLTNVEEAIRFVKETGVDALAVSIGNLHGEYKEPPKLRFDRLSEIKNVISTPIVLHGGSGISEEDFKRTIINGICKINIGTAVQLSSSRHVKGAVEKSFRNASYFSIMGSIIDGTCEAVKEHIRIFGSAGRATGNKMVDEEEELINEIVRRVLLEIGR